MKRTGYEARIDKHRAIREAESSGQVADSQEVRMDLIKRMHAGELTLEEVQSQLAAIKRGAKKNGLKTRSQVWSQS